MINDFLENKIFAEITIGDSASVEHTLTMREILLFAEVSGDINPAHLDPEYAKTDMFHQIIGHGMWTGSLISTVLGTKLPGPGTVYIEQTLKFLRPVVLGDVVTATATVIKKHESKPILTLTTECTNQKKEVVAAGQAVVLAPTEKVKRPSPKLPEITITS